MRWNRSFGFALGLGLLASQALDGATTVDVHITAPPRGSSCSLSVYRSEREIPGPFEKLCTINAERKTYFMGFDVTGKALEEANQRACLCGANAILLISNSSETQPPAYIGTSRPNYGGPQGSVSTAVQPIRSEEVVKVVALRVAPPPTPTPPPKPANQIRNGFRDLSWGDAITEAFKPIKEDDPKRQIRVYERPGDDLTIAKVPSISVTYGFSQSGLCAVRIYFDIKHWSVLKANLSDLWGEHQTCEADEQPACYWSNKSTGNARTEAALMQQGGGLLILMLANPQLYDEAMQKQRQAESGL